MARGQKRPQNSEIGPTESNNTSGNKHGRRNNLSFVEGRYTKGKEGEQSNISFFSRTRHSYIVFQDPAGEYWAVSECKLAGVRLSRGRRGMRLAAPSNIDHQLTKQRPHCVFASCYEAFNLNPVATLSLKKVS